MRAIRPATPRRRRRRTLTPTRPIAPIAPAAGPGLGAGGPPGLGALAGGMPSMKKGGVVKKTGPHKLHKGEKVVPAHKAKSLPPARTGDMGAAMKRGSFPPKKKR